LPETAAAKNARVLGSLIHPASLPMMCAMASSFCLLVAGWLRDAAEARVLAEKGGIGKILLLAPDSKE
jgi:hypothetical protein